jgi:HK97 family phage major capsid protein
MTIQELRVARAKKIDAFEALVAKMNAEGFVEKAEDTAAYDAAKAEIAGFDTKIARAEEANKLKATTALIVPETGKSSIVPARAMSGALKNFKGEKAAERAFRFGQFALASIFGNEKALDWCKENGIALQKAHGEGVNSAGGVFVPDEFSNEIIVLRDEYGMFRRLCRNWPMGRDTITVPRLVSGLTAYPMGESISDTATGITKSQAQWDNIRLTAKKWGILTLISSELDEDAAVNIGDILVGEMAYAFANAEDTAGWNGDGSGTYHGVHGIRSIFNAGVGSLAGAVDAASGHDTMAEMDATDIARSMGALPQYVFTRGRPTFYMSQTMWSNVFERLIGASGGVTKDQASGATVRSYNGYPVEISAALLAPAAATTDTSDVAMWFFGDLSMAAAFGDRRGMTVARSTEHKFAEDQIAIKATERFDINVYGTGTTTVAGPIVAMMGE